MSGWMSCVGKDRLTLSLGASQVLARKELNYGRMDERDLKQLTEEVCVESSFGLLTNVSLPWTDQKDGRRTATSSKRSAQTTTSSGTTNASWTSRTTCCTSSWSIAPAVTSRA